MSMDKLEGYIWSDGQLIDWQDAKVHILTHSLHYGCSVFEGIRAYDAQKGTAIFQLKAHTKRLIDSCKILQMPLNFDFDTLIAAQKEVVNANGGNSCYIRPLVYYGSERLGVPTRGISTHVAIASWPWGSYLGEEGLTKGIRVKTSSFSRLHVNVSMVRAKASGHYLNSIMASNEVINNGYDEAMLLDTEGYVSEGAGENLFLVRNGVLYSPELASCLDGITRQTVIAIAQDLGLSIVTKRITRDEVYTADEAFFTGTAAEVTPIREYDDRPIGAGQRGPITATIQTAYFDIVLGKNPKYNHWLDYIN